MRTSYFMPFALAAIGCVGGSTDHSQPVVRDSAGIAIVENAGPGWSEGEAWVVEATPMLQLGQIDGDDAHTFSNIADAVRLSDGSIAIAETGSSEIRFFDRAGRHIRSVGKPGAGPGEFRVVAAMIAIPGDSVAVIDPGNRRVSIAHPIAGITRSQRLPDDVWMVRPIGLLRGRSVLGYATTGGSLSDRGGRDTLDIIEITLDGGVGRRVARLPGDSREFARGFGPASVVAAAPDGFWFGTGETYELARYDHDGSLVRITRLPHTAVPVSADMIARAKAQDAEAAARFGVQIPERPFPQQLPPFATALTDSEGNVWVRPVLAEQRAVWNVLNPDGHYLGDVALPSGFIPFEIGADYVLTRSWDEFQVEYVHLHRLVKPRSRS